MRLKGKTAIVTGAGRGIGRAIAIGYAHEGARVVVNYSRSRDGAEETVRTIQAAGGEAFALEADVSRLQDHDHLISRAMEEFGAIDILVNNAGIEINEPVLESKPETWEATVDVNLKGAYFLACGVARVMARLGGGKIVNISSIHDVEPLRNRAVYSITKGGMLMMVKSLALELAGHNIHVNGISPGAILTDMNRKHLTEPARRDGLLARIPMKRIGDPEDIVGAAVFLASAESNYVTGTTIYVDGGLLLF
ncbi:3-oxoacyl-(acyl-carrier-protein) reductase FabG [Candidatus Sulfopaludibacter sp. SbA3]|nr:3-oxoacyl-(acyl-carrier-protein) reductase FabG [Candidatus Sulfopaludibacter sp. SbA3]